MTLSKEEVKQVAHLAHLDLSEVEITKYQDTLGELIDDINKINDIQTKTDEELVFVNPNPLKYREDVVEDIVQIDELMKNVPKKKGSFVEVSGAMINDEN